MAIRDGMLCIDFDQDDLEDGAYFSHRCQTEHGDFAMHLNFPKAREGSVMTLHLPLARATAKALGGQAKFLKSVNAFLVRDEPILESGLVRSPSRNER